MVVGSGHARIAVWRRARRHCRGAGCQATLRGHKKGENPLSFLKKPSPKNVITRSHVHTLTWSRGSPYLVDLRSHEGPKLLVERVCVGICIGSFQVTLTLAIVIKPHRLDSVERSRRPEVSGARSTYQLNAPRQASRLATRLQSRNGLKRLVSSPQPRQSTRSMASIQTAG